MAYIVFGATSAASGTEVYTTTGAAGAPAS